MDENMKKRRKIYIIILSLVVIVVALMVFLILNKTIHLTHLWAKGYDVQGVDVSHYQGEIDWKVLQQSGIDFAFIKATEGSSYIDEKFKDNWQAAAQTEMSIGAYHFFSFDSPGKEQAKLYIDTVGELSGKLVPVIDVEYYGDKEAKPPKKEKVVDSLQEMLLLLEQHYQVKPIIYTTYKVYKKYIIDEFNGYPLWIRNVYYNPNIDIGNKWIFWQYSDTSIINGYKGQEKYIDRNVFNGSINELKKYICK